MNTDNRSASEATPSAAHSLTPTTLDTLRARVMFLFGFGYLLLIAGLVHRAGSKSAAQFELDIMMAGLLALWPVFVVDVGWGLLQRDRSRRLWPMLLRALLVLAMPPWRMALIDPRTGLVWIPGLGWQEPGRELFKQLEKAFSVPMLLFAALILPILLIEYLASERLKELPALVLALDVGIAVIWVAFATEFVLKASIHPKPFSFVKERWLDVAIVVIPLLEFLLTHWADAAPLARLLRLSRAISPEQLARMQRLYRLQGLATKAWHALLLIEGVSRLLGFTPEKRLAQLEARIADLEEQLQQARREAEEMRAKIAARQANKAAPPQTRDETLPSAAEPLSLPAARSTVPLHPPS
ncbi:MAG: hypothetical protein RMJ56_04960 [Gemmataceae bacterium]|nr:hypothetical protein [Gemmata sp.]MDW8196940.1 hypothetical protein [Gemmataceae bacterium]